MFSVMFLTNICSRQTNSCNLWNKPRLSIRSFITRTWLVSFLLYLSKWPHLAILPEVLRNIK